MFITCSCKHCGQHIEFSTDDFQEVHRSDEIIIGQNVACPGCEKETAIFIPQSPPLIPRPPWFKAWFKRLPWKRILIIAAMLIAVIWGIAFAIHKIGLDNIARAIGVTAGTLIMLAAGFFVALLLIFWILFPVLMYFQLKRANELLESIDRKTYAAAIKTNSAQVERAL